MPLHTRPNPTARTHASNWKSRGLIGMACLGLGSFFLFQNIRVEMQSWWVPGLAGVSPTGVCLVLFAIGMVLAMVKSTRIWGALLAAGTVILGIVATLMHTHFYWLSQSLLFTLFLLGLPAAGAGLLFSAFQSFESQQKEADAAQVKAQENLGMGLGNAEAETEKKQPGKSPFNL